MRMSCNGCRVLRKGCGDSCTIRPCLQWIKTAQSQANATVFLAKFYGRAGLVNLINAGPQHLRPEILKSLLYEACGRIVNPIYGSAGLLSSGSWHLCQAAVEAVLRGAPIMQISSESAGSMSPPVEACDIRHVSKRERAVPSDQLHKVKKSRTRFKSSAAKPKPKVESSALEFAIVTDSSRNEDESGGSVSHELGDSQNPSRGGDSGEADCVSAETVEASLAKPDERADSSDVDLELTLGFGLGFGHWGRVKGGKQLDGVDDDTCKMEVGICSGSVSPCGSGSGDGGFR